MRILAVHPFTVARCSKNPHVMYQILSPPPHRKWKVFTDIGGLSFLFAVYVHAFSSTIVRDKHPHTHVHSIYKHAKPTDSTPRLCVSCLVSMWGKKGTARGNLERVREIERGERRWREERR